MATSPSSKPSIRPRIIIHGGAGNIKRENLPKESYEAYRASLLSVLQTSSELLSKPDATALDVATNAVKLLEDNPLFNCSKGAVFTRDGTVELESSIMVSSGYRKRGVGCMRLTKVKNPILLAREMLIRGEKDDGGGAQAHCQLSGEYLEQLAKKWGLEIVRQDYFFTQRRWDEHIRGLQRDYGEQVQDAVHNDPSWDGHEYLPQGTVGAVVLDRFGTITAATSTGGLTNKLPGRIGDTPTLGAGFWAEEWTEDVVPSMERMAYERPTAPALNLIDHVSRGRISGLLAECLPISLRTAYSRLDEENNQYSSKQRKHTVGMSGTGNGDSFLRVNAVRTASATSRFSNPSLPLSKAVTRMAGPGGELQNSAGAHWGRTGEGEGGIVGIELVDEKSDVVWDFNCGGMFRAWIDDREKHRFMIFRDEY